MSGMSVRAITRLFSSRSDQIKRVSIEGNIGMFVYYIVNVYTGYMRYVMQFRTK